MPSEGDKWAKWWLKLTIGIAASLILGPGAALLTGAAVGGGAAIVKECVEDENAKKVFGFIADCGKDVAIGGITGGVASAGLQVAIPVAAGAGAGGVLAKVAHDNVEDKDAKKVLGFVSGCAAEIAVGGAIGGAVDAVGGAVGKKIFQDTAKQAGKNADKVVGKAAGQWASEEIAKGGSKEFFSETARKITKDAVRQARRSVLALGKELGQTGAQILREAGFSGYEAMVHVNHVEEGISYKEGCAVCEA